MNATPNLTLWGVGTSRTIRPHWAMHELGLVYDDKADRAANGRDQDR